jgi:biotin-dependent carboxylase-like uncharacterized protein
MELHIVSPGPFTTVQDGGRYGYMASGIGTSGVMDRFAFEAANWLVGNKHGEAVLECTMMGPSILFEDDCICAVTGADMGTMIGNRPVEPYRPFWVQAGQTLTMGAAKNGCRGYLAVQGGFQVPEVMGSRSTNLKCRLGGYEGRVLKRDDVLIVPDEHRSAIMDRKLKAPQYSQNVTVRVVLGPQTEYFTEHGIDTLLRCTFTVSNQSDRMGLRLDGEKIETISGSDIISDGITLGSIQVTSSGQPIVLLADRQTTGGYAKIGTVCSFDIPLLAQLKPGGTVNFRAITVEQAQRIYRIKKWRIFR